MTIILTGLSGVGKTTIASILEREFGFLAFDTGDLWKAKYSLAVADEFKPDRVYKKGEALEWFMSSGLFERGIHLYNEFKRYRPKMAEQICTWIELDREYDDALPSKTVLAMVNQYSDRHIVTSAINDNELRHLIDLRLPNLMIVKLICTNRVERPADNRQEITLSTPNDFIIGDYRIEQTSEVAFHVAAIFRERLLEPLPNILGERNAI